MTNAYSDKLRHYELPNILSAARGTLDARVTGWVAASSDDDHPRATALPGPRPFARDIIIPAVAARGGRFFRRGPELLLAVGDGAPGVVNKRDVAERVREHLAEMPEDPGASEVYTNIRFFARAGSDAAVRKYLLSAVDQVRIASPVYRTPRAPRPSRATPPRERQRRSRADRDERGELTARAYIENLLLPSEDLPPFMIARELYARFVDIAEDWIVTAKDDPADWLDDGGAEEEGGPAVMPVVAKIGLFYRVADELLGPRRRVGGRWCYRLRDDDAEALADAVEGVLDVDELRRIAV